MQFSTLFASALLAAAAYAAPIVPFVNTIAPKPIMHIGIPLRVAPEFHSMAHNMQNGVLRARQEAEVDPAFFEDDAPNDFAGLVATPTGDYLAKRDTPFNPLGLFNKKMFGNRFSEGVAEKREVPGVGNLLGLFDKNMFGNKLSEHVEKREVPAFGNLFGLLDKNMFGNKLSEHVERRALVDVNVKGAPVPAKTAIVGFL